MKDSNPPAGWNSFMSISTDDKYMVIKRVELAKMLLLMKKMGDAIVRGLEHSDSPKENTYFVFGYDELKAVKKEWLEWE